MQAVQNEQEEEFITNKLMKSLNEAREEKTKMLMELEQEQEFLTNNLQRKLDLVMAEKSELENRLRKEEEYILLTKSLIENAQATKIELDDKLIQEGNQAIEGLKECLEVLLEEKKDHTLRDKLMRFLDFIKKEHDRLIESQTDCMLRSQHFSTYEILILIIMHLFSFFRHGKA